MGPDKGQTLARLMCNWLVSNTFVLRKITHTRRLAVWPPPVHHYLAAGLHLLSMELASVSNCVGAPPPGRGPFAMLEQPQAVAGLPSREDCHAAEVKNRSTL